MNKRRVGTRLNTEKILEKIKGIQTIESIKSTLGISHSKAVYVVYRLRKKGYVVTKQDSNHNRIYSISRENALGGTSYVDILNKYSPIKLASSEVYKIYGHQISIEETIVYSVKTRRLRYVLSSLALFKRIKNWNQLYDLAKKNDLLREIGALYELVEITFPRVKKINRFYLRHSIPKNKEEFKYLIPSLSSKDFSDIEKKWKIYIPLNKIDLMDYGNDIS